MRVLVMGAGALGSALGAILSQAGQDVTLVARGAHAEAMRKSGLELRRPSGSFRLPEVAVVQQPRDVQDPPDLVLFTVKTYDTLNAIDSLRLAISPSSAILCLQNGIDGVEELGRAFGQQSVIAGTTTFNAALVEPGVVLDMGVTVTTTLAELAGGVTARVESLAAMFSSVALGGTVSPDPQLTIWRKTLLHVPHAAITSACGQPMGPIFGLPEGHALYEQLVSEAVAVARSEKVALPEDMAEQIMGFYELVPAGAMSSMGQDFANNRRVELDQTVGTIVRRGHGNGVPTPGFDALYAVLKVRAIAFGGIK